MWRANRSNRLHEISFTQLETTVTWNKFFETSFLFFFFHWHTAVDPMLCWRVGGLEAKPLILDRWEINCTLWSTSSQHPWNPFTLSGHYMYRQWSLYVPHSGHYMYRQFNVQQFHVLPTQCIYVFCVDLRTNSDYFPIQHQLTGFCKRGLTLYSPVVTICTARFNIIKSYVLPTQCIYVFCVDLRTNRNNFPIQH